MSFGPDDVRAVVAGTASPQCVRAVLTSQTCGEPCWNAREETCRCSCGGFNHGCLLVSGAQQPVRTCRLDGHRYKLAAVGQGASDMVSVLNKRQYRMVERPFKDSGGHWHQYYYGWSYSDAGAPARLKFPTADQVQRWPELAAYRNTTLRPPMCWEIETWPEPPTQPRIDTETGLPK